MKYLLLFIALAFIGVGLVQAQYEPVLDHTILEAEGIRWGFYPRYFNSGQSCTSGGTSYYDGVTFQSNTYGMYWPATNFSCVFSFVGSAIGIRVTQGGSLYRSLDVEVTENDITSYLFTIDAAGFYYYEFGNELNTERIITISAVSGAQANTPVLDYILLESNLDYVEGGGGPVYPTPTPITFPATPTQITVYPTPTEITLYPTPTEITLYPTPTEIEAMSGTPDGATVYATVEANGYGQTVALRYEIDGGQIVIAVLLFAIFCVLMAMLISQWRRKAPEP